MSAPAQRPAPEKDVAVVGGGVVGLTLAARLGRGGLKVALIEERPPPAWPGPPERDPRVLALSPASRRVLEAAGAWEAVQAQRLGCFRRMEVWDEGSCGYIRFDSAELAEPALGYIVELELLRSALEGALARLPAVKRLPPAALEGWSHEARAITLRLSGGAELKAALVVGADGAESCVRRLAGIGERRREYDHHAVVCTVGTERPHGEVARQRFLRSGPLAFLPLDEARRCAIVWSTSPQHAAELVDLGEAEFCAALTRAFEGRLGKVLSAGPRARFALARAHAEHYVAPRLALVGDAAHRIHPLAGQGANLGLLDAASLSEVLIEARAAGRDLGSLQVLRRYERWRRGENALMQCAMDGFKLLFGSSLPPLRWLRGAGLRLTDRLAPVKALIMRRAMGLEGDLPRSARPTV